MYPRTIDNGHGERLTFLGRDGDRLLVSSEVAPGAGPPMHIHWRQTETMRVESGRMGVAMPGAPDRFLGPGELASFASGVEHRFWNAGDETLVLVGEVFPADNLEYFLTRSTRPPPPTAAAPAPSTPPSCSPATAREFAMTAIPRPSAASSSRSRPASGGFCGRYDQFADAPGPVPGRASATLPGRSATSARSSAG